MKRVGAQQVNAGEENYNSAFEMVCTLKAVPFIVPHTSDLMEVNEAAVNANQNHSIQKSNIAQSSRLSVKA